MLELYFSHWIQTKKEKRIWCFGFESICFLNRCARRLLWLWCCLGTALGCHQHFIHNTVFAAAFTTIIPMWSPTSKSRNKCSVLSIVEIKCIDFTILTVYSRCPHFSHVWMEISFSRAKMRVVAWQLQHFNSNWNSFVSPFEFITAMKTEALLAVQQNWRSDKIRESTKIREAT